jgi:hypothetical protein
MKVQIYLFSILSANIILYISLNSLLRRDSLSKHFYGGILMFMFPLVYSLIAFIYGIQFLYLRKAECKLEKITIILISISNLVIIGSCIIGLLVWILGIS